MDGTILSFCFKMGIAGLSDCMDKTHGWGSKVHDSSYYRICNTFIYGPAFVDCHHSDIEQCSILNISNILPKER